MQGGQDLLDVGRRVLVKQPGSFARGGGSQRTVTKTVRQQYPDCAVWPGEDGGGVTTDGLSHLWHAKGGGISHGAFAAVSSHAHEYRSTLSWLRVEQHLMR